ncbi:hypothetical protein BH11ACT3_BH11ACT3_15150 [soil metagenome]
MTDPTPSIPDPSNPTASAPAEPAATPVPGYSQQPYAGQAQPQYGQQQPYNGGYAPPTNTLAIVSLILSLVGVGLGGIITGHIALKQIKETGAGGHGLALAGTVIGYVAVGLGIIITIIYIAFFAVLAGQGAFNTVT